MSRRIMVTVESVRRSEQPEMQQRPKGVQA